MTNGPPPSDCPFMRRMLTVLAAELDQSDPCAEEKTFEHLLDLENDADEAHAPEPSRRIISRVRRMAAGHALQIQMLKVTKLKSATTPITVARNPARLRKPQ